MSALSVEIHFFLLNWWIRGSISLWVLYVCRLLRWSAVFPRIFQVVSALSACQPVLCWSIIHSRVFKYVSGRGLWHQFLADQTVFFASKSLWVVCPRANHPLSTDYLVFRTTFRKWLLYPQVALLFANEVVFAAFRKWDLCLYLVTSLISRLPRFF